MAESAKNGTKQERAGVEVKRHARAWQSRVVEHDDVRIEGDETVRVSEKRADELVALRVEGMPLFARA